MRIGKEKETFYDGFGVSVQMRFAASSPFGRKTQTLHNVTEIHRNYPGAMGPGRIAFESTIQGSGLTYELAHIERYKIRKETRKWPNL